LRAGRPALVAALAALSCGEPERTEAPPTAQPARPAVATRADPAGRAVVATVNGEPVYGDCVATQAQATGVDVDAALDQCIAFELLAQEAVRRGLAADGDVLEARRTEMVRALVDAEFAHTLDDPSDVADAELRWLWDTQLSRRYNRPELRRATYCRAPLAADAPVDGAEHRQARELADRLHAALSTMRDLEPARFAALCWMAAGGQLVKTTAAPTRQFARDGRYDGGAYAAQFAGAAFSVAQVGQVSVPTRTSWGWDVVLVTEIRPPESATLEQAEPEIRDQLIHRPETAEYRLRKFRAWIGRYLAAARVELFPDNLPVDHALAQRGEPSGDRP
jgi:hypothetical protein